MSRMPTGWRDVSDAIDWFRDMEKQMLREQRLRRTRTSVDASSIQGEAQQIIDWNDVAATYNGWYFTDVAPSTDTVGAQNNNSPDKTKAWLGQTRVDSNGLGLQYVSSYRTTPPVEYVRRFYAQMYGDVIVREQITYEGWQEAGGGGSSGSIPTGPAGGDLTGTYPNPLLDGVTFTFAVASTTWTLPHNLNKQYCQIFTTDNVGEETFGTITHTNANSAVVTWDIPMTGIARVSA